MSWSTRTSQPPILERALRALLQLISVSAVGAAQRTERVEVPRLLVSGWLENDSLSRDVAEWVAADLKRLISYPRLFVVSGQEMERQLAGQWYRRAADPMTAADLRLVARLMRADIIVDLATRRTRAGIEVVPRRVRADTGVIDSLPTLTASTEREAAARLARWLAENTLLIGIKP